MAAFTVGHDGHGLAVDSLDLADDLATLGSERDRIVDLEVVVLRRRVGAATGPSVGVDLFESHAVEPVVSQILSHNRTTKAAFKAAELVEKLAQAAALPCARGFAIAGQVLRRETAGDAQHSVADLVGAWNRLARNRLARNVGRTTVLGNRSAEARRHGPLGANRVIAVAATLFQLLHLEVLAVDLDDLAKSLLAVPTAEEDFVADAEIADGIHCVPWRVWALWPVDVNNLHTTEDLSR